MTIRHLKIFVAVAEWENMSRAAKELYISQPSVSQAMRELEEHYHVRLFERLAKKLYITDAGKQLLPYARHIIDSFEQMEDLMNTARERPTLRIGASVTVGTCLLRDFVKRLEEEKQLEVEVIINNTEVIERLVSESQIDIAIVEGSVHNIDMIQVPIYRDELVLVVGRPHPFYGVTSMSLHNLNNQCIISREDGSQNRNQYEQLLEEHHIVMKHKWQCTNTEAIKNIVIQGDGIAILSELLVKKELEEGSLWKVKVKGHKVSREIKMIYHKHKFISRPIEDFMSLSKTIIEPYR